MVEERYPGERRGLRLFLEELLPVLMANAGQPMLQHAIRRALGTGELAHLRHARQLFNHLPRQERQRLSAALLGRGSDAEPVRDERLAELEPRRAAISFALAEEGQGLQPMRVEYREEPESPLPVRVVVAPGTLPSVAADALRRVASMIEADRRLLSARFWQEGRPALEIEHRDAR